MVGAESQEFMATPGYYTSVPSLTQLQGGSSRWQDTAHEVPHTRCVTSHMSRSDHSRHLGRFTSVRIKFNCVSITHLQVLFLHDIRS